MDPRDPNAPELILSGTDGYHLDQNWKPDSIEYVYQWWGLGDPVFDYQQLNYQDGKYFNNKEEVPSENIKNLLGALSHLHPTQFLLAGNDHTDDYPSWTIELVDDAGNRILLFSSSTANPGKAPWNVLYNGRLFAQFDGSIGDSLTTIFSGPTGQPSAAFFPGGGTPGKVAFSTSGWPTQLTEGFVGLLPIADGFHYQADVATGKIKGFIQGRSSIAGLGDMVIGKITKIDEVKLTIPDGSKSACEVESVESSDPASAVWTFTCTPETVVAGKHYSYPLEVNSALTLIRREVQRVS
jgi:hypothetical protein